MTPTIQVIVHPVRDVAAAKALYRTLLGVEPYVDSPYYVGFKAGGLELGLDPNGHAQGMTGPVAFWQVADLKASIARLIESGATVRSDIRDVGGGMLIATLVDADGNPIGLRQAP
jgi:predicted enzyme related to lactoylglutathione lyase